MDFFNGIIEDAKAILSCCNMKSIPYDKNRLWQDVGRNEVVLMRDTAFELGSDDHAAVGFNLVTSADIGESTVVIAGNDICDIKGDCSFARISLIQIDDIEDEQAAYGTIRKIEYVKYHFHPQGYMMRTYSESHREQARISKAAVKSGISFESVGNSLIKKYMEQPAVKAVKVFFITDQSVAYDKLYKLALKNNEITAALNHALNNVNFDCSSCNLKPVCDEVEGMRELHFKNSGMQM